MIITVECLYPEPLSLSDLYDPYDDPETEFPCAIPLGDPNDLPDPDFPS